MLIVLYKFSSHRSRSSEQDHCSSTMRGGSWSPLDTSLGRWSGSVPPRGDPRKEPGHSAGGRTSSAVLLKELRKMSWKTVSTGFPPQPAAATTW